MEQGFGFGGAKRIRYGGGASGVATDIFLGIKTTMRFKFTDKNRGAKAASALLLPLAYCNLDLKTEEWSKDAALPH